MRGEKAIRVLLLGERDQGKLVYKARSATAPRCLLPQARVYPRESGGGDRLAPAEAGAARGGTAC